MLVIAGSDSSGGAGLVRDLRVLTDFGVDALCVVTAVTAQSDSRTVAVHHVPPEIVSEQVAAAFATRLIDAIKIGMLGTRATVETVAAALPSTAPPIVLDPVLVASSGGTLLDEGGREAMRRQLFPRATLITPNIPEAAALLRQSAADNIEAMIGQARQLLRMGPRAVLIKGGHAAGEHSVDVLVCGDDEPLLLAAPRVNASRRGTGCTLASAVAASLAGGSRIPDACRHAKRYLIDWLNDSSVRGRGAVADQE